jgi:uncharacterized membrane protein
VTGRDHGTVSLTARRVLAVACALLGLATVIGVVTLWPDGDVANQLIRDVVGTPETYDARILEVITEPCEGTTEQDDIDCFRMTFQVLEGVDEDDVFEQLFSGDSPLAEIEAGTTIVVARNPDVPPELRYSFVDVQRRSVLIGVAVVFAAAVVLLGRLRGLAALLGLVATFLLISEFVLPSLLQGHDPTIVAAFGAAAIAFIALYAAHGFGPMTSIALLGTLSSLILTVVIGAVFVGLAKFSGFSSEEAFLVNIGAAGIDLSGLVLAGVIIGALGAIDDMTVTQSSAIAELARVDPRMSRSDLFRSGLRIGRDHVASTVNTLFLAYAGASLPLLLLFVLSDQSAAFVANREIVATEIVRTLVGSIGLVASVPITTWLAAFCTAGRGEAASSSGDDDGSAAAFADDDQRSVEESDEQRAPDELYIPESRFHWLRRRR